MKMYIYIYAKKNNLLSVRHNLISNLTSDLLLSYLVILLNGFKAVSVLTQAQIKCMFNVVVRRDKMQF